jgi:hypothetical protein
MSGPRDRAVALLVNYFEAVAKKAGMPWQPDYTAELGEAVDAILEAALDEARADDAIGQRMDAIDRRLDKHERRLRDGGL